MSINRFTLTVAGIALCSFPALAQTPSSPPPASATAGAAISTSNFMTAMKPGIWRASKLDGLNVYNNANEKIGDISDVLVDGTGRIEAVVIGVGGFLGMGQHDVAVPFADLKWSNEPVRSASATTTSSTTTANSTMAPCAKLKTPLAL